MEHIPMRLPIPLPYAKHTSVRFLFLLLMVAALTPLHAGSTKMVSSWSAPEAKGVTFNKLLAVVVTAMPVTRQQAEDEIVSILRKRGNSAQASYELLSEAELEDLASAKAKVASSGADGAILLRLHTFNRSTSHQPYGGANAPPIRDRVDPTFQEYTFFSDHASSDDLTYDKMVVEIETMVYSLKDDKLLWRGVSRTKQPLGPRIVTQEIMKEVAKKMKQQGLIKK
jgi:hypothetical protein